jgi:branched-chain amino acid transport system ATP-binding protein
MMMLKVDSISAAYEGIEALREVSLEIDEGDMVSLIGPNGAGKSTLLNCLSGIVPVRRGSVEFSGWKISSMRSYSIARKGLLQVPEGRQILTDLTVEENLLLGELARGSRTSKYGLRDVYALFPILEDRRALYAGSLSGGQQQILGLGPQIVDQVFKTLSTLNAGGLTILLVEQNAHRALQATERAYVLEGGRIVYEGASADLAKDARVIEHYLGREPSIPA